MNVSFGLMSAMCGLGLVPRFREKRCLGDDFYVIVSDEMRRV